MMLLINGTTSGRSANKTVRTMSNVTSGLSVGSVIVNSGAIQTITDLPIARKLAISETRKSFFWRKYEIFRNCLIGGFFVCWLC